MAINAEQLNIILAARDEKFTKAMDRSQRRVEMFARKSNQSLSKTSKSFDMVGAAAMRLGGVISVGALATGMTRAIDNATRMAIEIDNLSRVAGVSTERFQELAYASEKVGVDQGKLSDILKDTNDKFGDYIATGAGPLADFFDNIAPKVNLTKQAFIGLSSEQALGKYVKALQDAGVNQQEMTFYMEALASDATAIAPLFYNNSAALGKFAQAARDTGVVIDQDLIEKSVELRRQWDEIIDGMTTKFQTFAMTVAVGINNIFAANDIAMLSDLESKLEDLQSKREEINKSSASIIGESKIGDLNLLDQGLLRIQKSRLESISSEIETVTFAIQDLKDNTDPIILDEIIIDGDNGGSGTTSAKIDKAAKSVKKLKEEITKLDEVMPSIESAMERAFMSMADGTSSVKDAFRSMAADIIKQLYRVYVVQNLVSSILGPLSGPSTGTGGLPFGKASGGPVQAGQPYTVGEHGRELFVPQTAGRILSVPQTKAAMSGGGGGVTVVQNINISTGVQQTVRAEIKTLMPQIADAAKSAVVDAKRRGGSYGRAMA